MSSNSAECVSAWSTSHTRISIVSVIVVWDSILVGVNIAFHATKHASSVLAQMQTSVQNAKMSWKNLMKQMEVPVYVAVLYARVYASVTVQKGNTLILTQDIYQFASLAIRIVLPVMDQKITNASLARTKTKFHQPKPALDHVYAEI